MMAVTKNRLIKHFSVIPNSIISDITITATAFRVYCYLVSKHDGWKVLNADIQKQLDIGRDALIKSFRILIAAGWITRQQQRDEKGHLLGYLDYQLNETKIEPAEPLKTPTSVKTRIPENTDFGKIRAYNNTNISINKTESISNNPLPPEKIITPAVAVGDRYVSYNNQHMQQLSEIPEVRKSAIGAWKYQIELSGMEFTADEMNAIVGYAISKPNLQPITIKANLILLEKWAKTEALDIEDCLLRSIQTRALIKPFMKIYEDDRGNRLTRQQCINKRQQIIDSEKRDKTQHLEPQKSA
jgi:hypothetical protein